MEANGSTETTRLLVTVDEAARRLSLSVRSVWKLIAAGNLPAVRIGRCTRIRLADLDALANRGVR